MKIKAEKNKSQAFSDKEIDTILAAATIGVVRLDAQYNLSYANPAFNNIVRYSNEELLNKNFAVLLSPGKNLESLLPEIFSPDGELKKVSYIAGLVTKAGEKISCHLQINHFIGEDGESSFIMLVKDASPRIAEEKLLKESLLRYNILSKATQEGLWDWNMLTKEIYYNDNIKALFGYDDDEMKEGLNWWKLNIHEDDQYKIFDKLQLALHEKNVETLHNEYRFKCKDGSYKIIVDWLSILRDEDGKAYRIIVSMQDYTEQRDLEKQLTEKEVVYRRQLARTVMDTQESERRKLAEELHDNVNQLLGVVKLYIEHSITNDNIREGLLRKSNEYIDKAIVELRNLSKNLAPPLLKELGLEHSVNSLADVIAGVQDINITVDMLDFDDEGLTESHMLMIYRVIQEQLNNITKHAKAKNVSITIKKTDTKVQLTVIDDGVGVDLSANNTGMGLRNIRNRIELYQGRVEMITSPNNGFILKVEFEI